ncbi:MAG: sugar ABC transporter permease [Lachnospiraceae bacterium]|jgi:ABC-type sugar transport system permease subunit|nr:sugar ABC transporter permease [Lachnospiraceae bacterium]
MSKGKVKKDTPKIKAGRLARREAIAGLLFVSPWIAGAIIFLFYTMGTSFYYALNNIRITPRGKSFTFLGTGNFTQILLSDADFPTQLIDYVVSTLISVPVIVVFALIIAMLLNGKIRMRGFFRLIFFLPVIVVSGPVMGMLSEQGAATISTIDTQAIVRAMEGVLPSYISDSIAQLFESMITILWYSGVQILIFLSALQKIDASMYEAAQIDGGSGWECFWKITLPTIKPMILLNVVYTVVFISGNDQNSIITLIQNSMFSGTSEKGYGYASAMAWLYSLVVVLIVVFFAVLLMTRKDAYQKQVKRVKRAMKKEVRSVRKIERRGNHNVKKLEKARKKRKYATYDGSDEL